MQVELTVRAPIGLPSVWAGCPVQVSVVLRNLIDNALEAALEGDSPRKVLVALSSHPDEQRILVSDSGPGVEADKLVALFTSGASTKPGGMGIGLSICRAICEAHGGRLWAESGVGGRFWVALPDDAAQAADTPEEQPPDAAS